MAKRLSAAFAWWNHRLPSAGTLAMAAFILAVVSGVLLALPFDVGDPADSVELLEIASPAARLLRAAHGWAGNLLVILTLLHAVEHLLSGTETALARGVWLRVVLLIPVLLLVMITGFILKGDSEGRLAMQIVAGLIGRIPWIGGDVAVSLLGTDEDLQLAYVHHAATLTLVAWILVVEHARRLWPSAGAALAVTIAVLVAATAAPPTLHDVSDPAVQGPWYFVAVQEVLHWTARPGWIWLPISAALLLLAALPSLPEGGRRRAKQLLAVLLLVYSLLTVWTLGFRGAGWRVTWPFGSEARIGSRADEPVRSLLAPARSMTAAGVSGDEVPRVLGRREGCLVCHSGVTGLSPAHAPEAVGCRSCHLGDPFTLDAERAHLAMVRVPGNLDTAHLSCGGSGCHREIVTRVSGSLMATGAGMIAVDRFVFGEAPAPDGAYSMADLGSSPADTHLKNLCVPCHLGTIKEEPSPTSEESRGGGCAACHLSYPEGSRYSAQRAEAFVHPALDLRFDGDGCFGCHSRSGRISLGYEGWSETLLAPEEAAGRPAAQWRTLDDGRVLRQVAADVHHERGMECIDCHTSREAMGNGTSHLHEEEAVEIACSDCHRSDTPRTISWRELDPETRSIVRLREGGPAGRRFVVAERSGEPLVNVTVDERGAVVVMGKASGRTYRPKAPVGACAAEVSGHGRLSCRSCHTAWAPWCISCHTQYDPTESMTDPFTGEERRGRYVEYADEPRTDPPALGVRNRDGAPTVVPFVPGMIMTLNTDRTGPVATGGTPLSADGLIGETTVFHRLYSPVAPHTTSAKGRSCVSCHSDPLAVGFGRGELELAVKDGVAAWSFTPTFERLARDGLPADAWTGFLRTRPGLSSTRIDARPFDRTEQERILRVGACLTCHAPESAIYDDFDRSLAGTAPACLVPGESR